MAYDPEARETSNSAMIIGIVVLVLMVVGALAYFATRPNDANNTPGVVYTQPETVTNTVVVNNEVPVPVDNGPDTVIVNPPPAAGQPDVQVDVNASSRDGNNPPPANPAPPVDSETNVTINNQPPAGAGSPGRVPPAGDEAGADNADNEANADNMANAANPGY